MSEARFPELAGAKAVVTGGANGHRQGDRRRAFAPVRESHDRRHRPRPRRSQQPRRSAALRWPSTCASAPPSKRRWPRPSAAWAASICSSPTPAFRRCSTPSTSPTRNGTTISTSTCAESSSANQIAARGFKARGKGVIVNTASLAAKVGAPLLAHYSASKFAVLGWTQALARELAPAGIRVNAVCPGFVKTGMQEREIAWEAAFARRFARARRRRLCRANAARTARNAGGRRRRRRLPLFRFRAFHDRPGRQRHRRRLYDVKGALGTSWPRSFLKASASATPTASPP